VHRGFGVSNRETGTPATAPTHFNVGALAKSLTAAAILALERDGLLSVHDSLTRWLGPLPAPKNRATIHHLLTHTAGLTRAGLPVFAESRNEFLRAVAESPPEFAPGSRQRYTDIGSSMLAAIIEIASGMPYELYVRTRLLEPAGMRETYFEPEAARVPVAAEYSSPVDASSRVGARPYVWGRRGGMGVVSTVEDLVRWHRALENGLLGRAALAQIYGAVRDSWRGVVAGYGWETTRSSSGTTVNRLLSGWPGNSVELAYEPETRTVVALVIDTRVDWSRPRYDELLGVVQGADAAPAARRMVASSPE
jgi:CubicO group peptidase (beta-lactamase class C family)